MKRIKLLILTALLPILVYSQGVELVPFAGYMFGGKIKYYEGELKLDNGMDYGISVLVPVQYLVDLEINYSRMESDASFTPYYGYPDLSSQKSSVATNYLQVGGISKFYNSDSKVTPFGSFSLGATWFTSSDFNDVWRFSMALGLGVKVMFSDRVGIMLRGRLLMPMYFGGVGMYAGTGGAGVGVSSVVAPLQGDFNGGLIIKLGN